MVTYKEFQFGWLIFLILIPIYIVLAIFYVLDIGDKPLESSHFLVITAVFSLVCLLFYGMTTRVTKKLIVISYGMGLIRKRIATSRIKDLRVVRNSAIYGWGIRLIPNGILFNISGLDAVELTFTDTKRIIRIGTKDPERLKSEILKVMDT